MTLKNSKGLGSHRRGHPGKYVLPNGFQHIKKNRRVRFNLDLNREIGPFISEQANQQESARNNRSRQHKIEDLYLPLLAIKVSGGVCLICLSDMKDGVMMRCCSEKFCPGCLLISLSSRLACPACRWIITPGLELQPRPDARYMIDTRDAGYNRNPRISNYAGRPYFPERHY